MALAERWTTIGLRLPLPFPVTSRLTAAALLPPLARPIPVGRSPSRPTPRRLLAVLATVTRERMSRRKPLLAPLQETNPRSADHRCPAVPSGDLPSRWKIIMLNQDQGSCCSRRSSPGVELSTPLRDALLCSLLTDTTFVQLNHTTPLSPPILPAPTPPGPPPAAIHHNALRHPGPVKLAPS
jgi:hypothetical protein